MADFVMRRRQDNRGSIFAGRSEDEFNRAEDTGFADAEGYVGTRQVNGQRMRMDAVEGEGGAFPVMMSEEPRGRGGRMLMETDETDSYGKRKLESGEFEIVMPESARGSKIDPEVAAANEAKRRDTERIVLDRGKAWREEQAYKPGVTGIDERQERLMVAKGMSGRDGGARESAANILRLRDVAPSRQHEQRMVREQFGLPAAATARGEVLKARETATGQVNTEKERGGWERDVAKTKGTAEVTGKRYEAAGKLAEAKAGRQNFTSLGDGMAIDQRTGQVVGNKADNQSDGLKKGSRVTLGNGRETVFTGTEFVDLKSGAPVYEKPPSIDSFSWMRMSPELQAQTMVQIYGSGGAETQQQPAGTEAPPATQGSSRPGLFSRIRDRIQGEPPQGESQQPAPAAAATPTARPGEILKRDPKSGKLGRYDAKTKMKLGWAE